MTQTEDAVESTTDAALLEAFLLERDVACPLCRYNLRGLQTSRCPECGRELRLSVGLAEPRMAAWVVAAAASLLPAGVGMLLVFAIIANGWDDIVPDELLLLLSMFAFIGFIPVAAAIVLLRRRFMRLRQSTQWTLAGVVTVGAGVSFAGYMMGFV